MTAPQIETVDGRDWEIIDGKRCILGATAMIAAQARYAQALADCDYILEFSDQYEGWVRMWRDQLANNKQAQHGVFEELAARAEEIQKQRRLAAE